MMPRSRIPRTAAPALLAVFWATTAAAQPMGPGSGWDDRYGRMMQGWGCGLAWLLALGALVVLAAVLLRGHRPGATADRGPGNAIEALDLRYARGEIDREDYLRRRADILGLSELLVGQVGDEFSYKGEPLYLAGEFRDGEPASNDCRQKMRHGLPAVFLALGAARRNEVRVNRRASGSQDLASVVS